MAPKSNQPGWRHPLQRWLFQWRGPESGAVVLTQRRVFVLPSRAGLGFLLLLLLLLVGSINYSLSLGFALSFLLAACGVIDILLTFRNLAHLQLLPARAAPVFAGDSAQFELELRNPSRFDRYALWLAFLQPAASVQRRWQRQRQAGAPLAQAVDVAAGASQRVTLTLAATRRGWLAAPRVRLHTCFPLGLVRAWSYWQPDLQALVYPQPEALAPPLPLPSTAAGSGHGHAGHEDFAGVRTFRAGDPLQHLAWRQIARLDLALGGTLLTKEFDGGGTDQLTLELDSLPSTLALEQKLARLTRWVLDADAVAQPYALKLGTSALAAGQGAAHRHACLQALALYPPVNAR